jgi:hypothetical protein
MVRLEVEGLFNGVFYFLDQRKLMPEKSSPILFSSSLLIAVLENPHFPFQPLIYPHCISSLDVTIVQE